MQFIVAELKNHDPGDTKLNCVQQTLLHKVNFVDSESSPSRWMIPAFHAPEICFGFNCSINDVADIYWKVLDDVGDRLVCQHHPNHPQILSALHKKEMWKDQFPLAAARREYYGFLVDTSRFSSTAGMH